MGKKHISTYEDGVHAAMAAIDFMRTSEAGDFKDPKCQGQRGEDRSNAFYDAYKAVCELLPKTPSADRGGQG